MNTLASIGIRPRLHLAAAIAVAASLGATSVGAAMAQDVMPAPGSGAVRLVAQGDELSQPQNLLPAPPSGASPLGALGDEPVSHLTIDVAPQDREIPIMLEATRPADSAQAIFNGEPIYLGGSIGQRGPLTWDVLDLAQFCHPPLYFDDDSLERYGCGRDHCQAAASAVQFLGSVLTLPFQLRRQPPHDSVSTPHPLY